MRKFTKKSVLPIGLVASAILLASCASSDTAGEAGSAEVAEQEGQGWDERLVDAPSNPEDLVAVPGQNSILISGMSGDPGADAGAGALYLLDPETEEAAAVWPGGDHETAYDDEVFADCPAPPDLSIASPHGISIDERPDGSSYLYMVNHGGRESIEVFTVDAVGEDDVDLTWVGCSVLPEGSMGNGVVADPDSEGFYVTHFFDPTDMLAGFKAAFANEDTGHVLHWTPDGGWNRVPGSEMSTPNGVEVSEDGRYLFVTSWGGRELHRFNLAEEAEIETVELGFMPDNLRWNDEGSMLLTGQDIDSFETFRDSFAGDAEPAPGYSVVEIDADAFTVTEVASGEPEGFVNPSTALGHEGEIWVGSVDGEYLVRLATP